MHGTEILCQLFWTKTTTLISGIIN
jgi:hypothetical protein